MNRVFGILSMLVREHLVGGDLVRKPEELLVMDAQDQVAAWHGQGDDEGPIVPVYHLNALACSRLSPKGGTVVDLGCGSGRFATYLARRRPDLRVVGYDLSAPMVTVGNTAIADAGLSDRVELRVGDMTDFARLIPGETALVSSVFALHHLPTLIEVRRCFDQLRVARDATGCALWLFDLARPRHTKTAYDYPEVLTPDAPKVFKDDSTNSLLAAYSHAELKSTLSAVLGNASFRASLARLFPLYQAFWASSRQGVEKGGAALPFTGLNLPPKAIQQYRMLRAILFGIPL